MNKPEEEIYRVQKFIQELSKVQDLYFEQLVESLGLNKEGEDFLFDFIFNETSEKTFEEYLQNYGRTFIVFK